MTTTLLSPVPASATQAHARVNAAGMLRQIGDMFASPSAALAEVVQNATRAGATRLDVTYDEPARTLTFADNGSGLRSLAPILEIATSAWDRTDIVDPAGMGAFALFALSDAVVIESTPADGTMPWQAQFTRELLTGAPADQWPMPDWSGRACGLTLKVTLRPDVTLPSLQRPDWRHRYPITVTVNGTEVPMVALPALTDGVETRTAAGHVTLGRTNGYWQRAITWDGRVLQPSDRHQRGIQAALGALATTLPAEHAALCTALVDAVGSGVIHWNVDPRSGVRPKLPDRDVLIENDALTAAYATIAAALWATVDPARVIASYRDAVAARAIWSPTRLGKLGSDIPIDGFGGFGAFAGRLTTHHTAALAGLVPTQRTTGPRFSLRDLEWNELDDGGGFWPVAPDTSDSVYVRPAYVASATVAELANAVGVPTAISTDDTTGLPTLLFNATAWTYVPTERLLVAADLHLVTLDGVRVADVRYTVPLIEHGYQPPHSTPEEDAVVFHPAALAVLDAELLTTAEAIVPGTAETIERTILTDPSFQQFLFGRLDAAGALDVNTSESDVDLDADLRRTAEAVLEVVVDADTAQMRRRQRQAETVADTLRELRAKAADLQREITALRALDADNETLTRVEGLAVLVDGFDEVGGRVSHRLARTPTDPRVAR